MASQTAIPAAEFETSRTISDPTAILLSSSAEYELTVSKDGYRSASPFLGEVPLSRVTGWDFFFSPLLLTRLFTWVVMAPWYRITRPRRVRLRAVGAAGRSRVSVTVALASAGARTTLSLLPDEPVEVSVLRKA